MLIFVFNLGSSGGNPGGFDIDPTWPTRLENAKFFFFRFSDVKISDLVRHIFLFPNM